MSDTVHDVPAGAAPQSRRRRWFAIGAVAVAAASLGLLMVGGIGQNLVYYWGPTELHAAGDKAVDGALAAHGLRVG